jgi:rhodanese-related sulfurtransferase
MLSRTTVASLYATLALPDSAVILDVRDEDDCLTQPRIIPGAQRRDPSRIDEWLNDLHRAPLIVAYGTNDTGSVSTTTQRLAEAGHAARLLEGGIDAWMSAGYPTARIRGDLRTPGASRWVTRERPKIDRLACPWLIRRFLDPEAQFFYVPSHRVRADAKALGAEPYDIQDVAFSHRGPRCSFDAFLEEFDLHDPVLDEVAAIVRAADTGMLRDSREAPGLLAISLGLSVNFADDILLLEQAMPIYDALYAWRKAAADETHAWPQTGS